MNKNQNNQSNGNKEYRVKETRFTIWCEGAILGIIMTVLVSNYDSMTCIVAVKALVGVVFTLMAEGGINYLKAQDIQFRKEVEKKEKTSKTGA